MYEKTCKICGDKFTTKINRVNTCDKTHIGKCRLCNKDFVLKRSNQKYCSIPHPINCFHCGKSFMLQRAYRDRTKYSCGDNDCQQALTKYSNIKKYGVENVFQSEEIKDKIKNTNLERHGVEYPGQNKQIMAKVHNTMIKKYGAKTPTQTKKFKEKIKNTNIERYGVDNPAKREDVQATIRATNKERYGVEHTFQSEKIKHKINETNLMRYGTKNPRWGNKESREKAEETNLKRYGHINPFGSQEIQQKIEEDTFNKHGVRWITQVDSVKEKMRNTLFEKYGVYNPAYMQMTNYKDWMNFENFIKPLNYDCIELANYFDTSISSIRQKAYNTDTPAHIKDFYRYSKPELEVKHLLMKLGLKEGVDFIAQSRKVIPPLELDFYLPNLNLAIEISPTYTHNSKQGWNGEGEGLSKHYHYNKFELCSDKNIELITLFEWCDSNIITGAIMSKQNNNYITSEYGYIETFNFTSEIKKFLNLNHDTFKNEIYRICSIKKNSEIIAAFIWLENSNKYKSVLKHYKCNNTLNKNILINFVLSNYKNTLKSTKIKELIIVSDSSVDIEAPYINANFEVIREIGPRLNYHHMKNNFHIKSSKLIAKNVSELENNGFLPIYDCGHKQWRLIL